MAKWGKRLFGLAAIGGAAAGLVYYLKSKEDIDMDEFEDEFEDNDFDLDNDLKASGEREYVPLTPKKSEDEVSADEESADEDAVSEDEFADIDPVSESDPADQEAVGADASEDESTENN